jgi:hypothetical protein
MHFAHSGGESTKLSVICRKKDNIARRVEKVLRKLRYVTNIPTDVFFTSLQYQLPSNVLWFFSGGNLV